MLCPYCQKEMESGFLQGRDLHWKRNKSLIPALGGISAMWEKDAWSFSYGSVEAWRCTSCEKILVDYKAIREAHDRRNP